MRHRTPTDLLILAAVCAITGCGEPAGTPAGQATPAPPTAAEPSWFASVDGGQVGPFTEAALRAEIRAGRIGTSDHVWREGMDDWVPASSVLDSAPVSGGASTDAAGAAFLALCGRADGITDDDLNTLQPLLDPEGPTRTPQAAARSVLSRHGPLLADLRGGLNEVGQLDLDYAQGPMLLLPHLAQARRLARLLAADAAVRTAAGESDIAAADCAAMARLTRQVVHDRTVISSLVAMAIAHLFAATCERSGISGDAPVVGDSTRWLEEYDPFGLAGAYRTERSSMVDAAAQALRDGRAAEFARIEGMDRARAEAYLRASNNLDRNIERCRSAYDELISLVARTRRPPAARIDALVDRVVAGEYGELATALVPPAARLTTQAGRALGKLDPLLAESGP
jgi:hypothetical protein